MRSVRTISLPSKLFQVAFSDDNLIRSGAKVVNHCVEFISEEPDQLPLPTGRRDPPRRRTQSAVRLRRPLDDPGVGTLQDQVVASEAESPRPSPRRQCAPPDGREETDSRLAPPASQRPIKLHH